MDNMRKYIDHALDLESNMNMELEKDKDLNNIEMNPLHMSIHRNWFKKVNLFATLNDIYDKDLIAKNIIIFLNLKSRVNNKNVKNAHIKVMIFEIYYEFYFANR